MVQKHKDEDEKDIGMKKWGSIEEDVEETEKLEIEEYEEKERRLRRRQHLGGMEGQEWWESSKSISFPYH